MKKLEYWKIDQFSEDEIFKKISSNNLLEIGEAIGDKQHVHIEEKNLSGKWQDATDQHRIYFEGDLK